MTLQDWTKDPKIDFFHQCLQQVLSRHDESKVADFFTDDAVVIINDRRLEGKAQICERLKWIRANTPKVSITLHRAFFQGDRGFDHHTSDLISENGNKVTFKVFGYIEMREGKIALYEDITIQLTGDSNALFMATSTTSSSP